ncbi:hypothetical protein SAVIM338S_00151 [Streptomyces avidinii]
MEGRTGPDRGLRCRGPGRRRCLLRARGGAGLQGDRQHREARREDALRPGETLLRGRRRGGRARCPGRCLPPPARRRVRCSPRSHPAPLRTLLPSRRPNRIGSDSPAVRLGGVHALAGLADDAPDDSLRQTCVDVLCAYLQLPFTPDPGEDPAHRDEHHRYLALRKVRHTILRLIGDHYRRPGGTHRSWQGCDLDLTGVTIDGSVDFSGTVFSGGAVNFSGAAFTGGVVFFGDAVFSGHAVDFGDARFSGGTVDFDAAQVSGSGGMDFTGATGPAPWAPRRRRHSRPCDRRPAPRLAARESVAWGGQTGLRRGREG